MTWGGNCDRRCVEGSPPFQGGVAFAVLCKQSHRRAVAVDDAHLVLRAAWAIGGSHGEPHIGVDGAGPRWPTHSNSHRVSDRCLDRRIGA